MKNNIKAKGFPYKRSKIYLFPLEVDSRWVIDGWCYKIVSCRKLLFLYLITLEPTVFLEGEF